MRAIDTLTNVAGLYGLTPDGELGVYGEGKKFLVDAHMSRAFAPQIRQLLRSYLADPEARRYRLGLVYRSPQPRSWSSDTLVLEESVIREVYPVGGAAAQEPSEFQKRNREKSIYRGIELLIEYRYERLADSPVYCPLLYDRGTTLDQYPSNLGFAAVACVRTPVLELLNLLAMMPFGRRNTSDMLRLMQNMHRYLVRKEPRRDEAFARRKEGYVASPGYHKERVHSFDIDERHEPEQTPVGDTVARQLAAVDARRSGDRVDQVEQWLDRPHHPVDGVMLRTFVQFRHLDETRLATLAARTPVYAAPGGAKLLHVGMKDAWNMYLLEGTVSLEAADGHSLFITGGTPKAEKPISFLKPRKYHVTAITRVRFLWIHDALLEAMLDPAQAPQRLPQAKP